MIDYRMFCLCFVSSDVVLEEFTSVAFLLLTSFLKLFFWLSEMGVVELAYKVGSPPCSVLYINPLGLILYINPLTEAYEGR